MTAQERQRKHEANELVVSDAEQTEGNGWHVETTHSVDYGLMAVDVGKL